MGFSASKRKFFVEALGEERVRQMELHLPALGKDLEALGVRFKQLYDDTVTFGDADAVRLFHVFMGIAENIISEHELSIPEKLEKLRQAVSDLASRVGTAGGGVRTLTPASRYIDDIIGQRPVTTKAAKSLRATGAPGAEYVADLMDRGPVR